MGQALPVKPIHRLAPIEGLRAYLALWVVVTHVLFFSSAALQTLNPASALGGVVRVLQSGPLAVQVFMIISGFVITLLLDKRRENYAQFITRRFFRLYPVYILLIVVNLAVYAWRSDIFVHSQHYMNQEGIDYLARLGQATSDNWWPALLLHLVMLHGLTPGSWVDPMTVYSFIIAGWSISVEWEYYLLAPLIYALLRSPAPLYRYAFWAGALALFLAVRHWYSLAPSFFIFMPYFFIGAVSYFGYRSLPTLPANAILPATLGLVVFFFVALGRDLAFLPLAIWIPFFALLCEPADSMAARLLLGLFNNRPIQLLGACSYGIYLCHEAVILGAQALLLAVAPNLAPITYLFALLALTLVGTVALAALLHRLVELPGMELGRWIAAKIRNEPITPTDVVPAPRASE